MKNVGYKDVTPPIDRRGAEIESIPEQSVEMDFNKIKKLELSADLAIKVATGEKTSLVTGETVGRHVKIPVGATELRIIGGNVYMVTNRGMMTIAQFGYLSVLCLQVQYKTFWCCLFLPVVMDVS